MLVYSTDAFGTSGMKHLVEVLKGAGVEPLPIQGYTNNSPDFTPVAFAVKQSGADVMGTYTYRFQAFRLELPFSAVPRRGRDGNEAGILRMAVKLPLANDQRFSRVGGIGRDGAQAFHKMSRQGDRRNHPSPRSVEYPPMPMR
jgi:hypothetical protein